jgi:hypothetical protein
VDGPHEDQG